MFLQSGYNFRLHKQLFLLFLFSYLENHLCARLVAYFTETISISVNVESLEIKKSHMQRTIWCCQETCIFRVMWRRRPAVRYSEARVRSKAVFQSKMNICQRSEESWMIHSASAWARLYTFYGFDVKRRVANERRQATDEGTRGNWHRVVGNHKQTAANGILFFSSLILVKRTRSGAARWQLGAESAREAQITSLGIIACHWHHTSQDHQHLPLNIHSFRLVTHG